MLLVLIELQADHSKRENQRLNEHHIELLSPRVFGKAVNIDQNDWKEGEYDVENV